MNCEKWAQNIIGAIDTPGNNDAYIEIENHICVGEPPF